MTQEEIDGTLQAAADSGYKAFNAKIVNSALPMWGVRAPVLQELAKKIAKENGDFLDSYRAENYEQILLYALVLARKKMPLEEKYPYIDALLPRLENWAHVDMMLGAFSQLQKNNASFLARYRHLATGGEYERRFLAVFLMDYCLTDGLLGEVFSLYTQMQCDLYYTNMAIAWGLSVALVKFYEPTFAFLQKGVLNAFVRKKTVQKACESYRVPPERKAELKAFLARAAQ